MTPPDQHTASLLATTARCPDSPAAERVLQELLRALPDDHLVPRSSAVETPAVLACDESWLREQIRLRGLIWGIDDPFVLGTLWWYSASNWLVMPTVTSWFVTRQALSARLADVVLFHQPDSRIAGSRSRQVGLATTELVGRQLRESLAEVIGILARVIGKGERRLWSFAVDAIAGRILWAAKETGRVDEALEQSRQLVAAIDPTLPAPRLTSLEVATTTDLEQRHHVRRGSCCLLYLVPEKAKCGNCPRQLPAVRRQRLIGQV